MWAYIYSKGFFYGVSVRRTEGQLSDGGGGRLKGCYYWREFCLSERVGLTTLQTALKSLKHQANTLKRLTLTVRELIFRRAYYQKDLRV